MPRDQLIKLVLISALIILSLVSLYPTLQLSGIQEGEAALIGELSALSGLGRQEIESGLTQGELESLVRDACQGDTLSRALELSRDLIEINTKLISIESRAIRRGLDLQGGTFMVYEADLPQLLRDLAKNKDDRLEDIITATQQQVEEQGVDFFNAVQNNFRNRDIRLNRYFGRKGETDENIIKELQAEAEDAVDRTLEILRNRIDQFGVSEPSITKQGTRRIVIELAGIQNIERAKGIIGTTALLEFKLVKDPQIVWSVMDDIDRVVRSKRLGEDILTPEIESDSTQFSDGTEVQEDQVTLDDLFGPGAEDEAGTELGEAESDTALLVDRNTFSDKPFTSMLRQLGGRYSSVIAVPMQNVRAVQRILQMPEVEGVVPGDSQFLLATKPVFYGEESYQRLYLVKEEAELLGKSLTDADVQIGGGSASFDAGEAKVAFSLNSEGTKTFARVTGMNVGKQLAIVLDGKVAMAPNIKEKIPSGSGTIDGMASMDEAKDLALVLRAGALPAPVHPITENTVGPSLGHDSIDKGQKSALLGLVIVIIFMVFYYRASGLIADMALILNIIFVLAVMAGFHATLTLPGIAGIILTVGMAVDANVLIFERIREEIRTNKTIRASIDAGYSRAFKTILDANVTTLITAVVLYSFGTGPIKGFALTLSIGIVASMFTAIVVTRLVYDMITTRYAIRKLSI